MFSSTAAIYKACPCCKDRLIFIYKKGTLIPNVTLRPEL